MGRSGRHILHVFPGFDAGGTQMRTVQLMGMLPAGIRHTVLAMDGRYGCLERVPPGVEVATLGAPPRRSFWGMGRFMGSLLEAERPDAVMTYNWGSIEMVLGAKRRHFAPLIHHEDGFGPEEARRFLRRRIWIRRWLLPAATAVAVPSRVLHRLATATWRQPADKVHYLPNGVDLVRFAPSAQAPADRPMVFGHVAHLRPEKNQLLLLDALARMTGTAVRLRIAGDGPERGALQARAQELGIAGRVEWVGTLADTAPFYREVDGFVLTSDTEQMPLTVLEAMASGLPVVSTDVGDVREMLHPANRGLVVAAGDAAALARALDRLAADPEQRRDLGAHNREHCALHYDRDACYSAWVDLYSRYL